MKMLTPEEINERFDKFQQNLMQIGWMIGLCHAYSNQQKVFTFDDVKKELVAWGENYTEEQLKTMKYFFGSMQHLGIFSVVYPPTENHNEVTGELPEIIGYRIVDKEKFNGYKRVR